MLFADDTNVFLSGRNANQLIRIMNGELLNIVDWLDSNKLSLNVSKTHFILFRSQGMRKPLINEDLIMKNETINQDHKTKFLGVIVDEKLTWFEHIQYIKCKIAKGIGIICKARQLLNSKTLCTLYYCFVYPYLNYCVEVWGDTFKTYSQDWLSPDWHNVLFLFVSLRYTVIVLVSINIMLCYVNKKKQIFESLYFS